MMSHEHTRASARSEQAKMLQMLRVQHDLSIDARDEAPSLTLSYHPERRFHVPESRVQHFIVLTRGDIQVPRRVREWRHTPTTTAPCSASSPHAARRNVRRRRDSREWHKAVSYARFGALTHRVGPTAFLSQGRTYGRHKNDWDRASGRGPFRPFMATSNTQETRMKANSDRSGFRSPKRKQRSFRAGRKPRGNRRRSSPTRRQSQIDILSRSSSGLMTRGRRG